MRSLLCKLNEHLNYQKVVTAIATKPESLSQFKVIQKLSIHDLKRLTKNELLTIVNDALNIATNENIRKELLLYKSELLARLQRTFFENVLPESFKLRLSSDSALTGILSPELNQKLVKMIKEEIYRHTEVDLQNGVIITDSDSLNNALYALKIKLLQQLNRYVYGESRLPNVLPTAASYQQFLVVINLAIEKLLKRLQNGKITDRYTPAIKQSILEPLQAIILLTNFDRFIEKFARNKVEINKEYYGQFAADVDKYQVKTDSYYDASFLDGYSNVAGEHTTPSRLKDIVSQIEIGNTGETLIANIVENVVVRLNNLYQDFDTADSEIIDFFNSLKTENKEKIKLNLLKVLKSSVKLRTMIGESKCDALYDWMYKYNQAYNNSKPVDADKYAEFELSKDLLMQLVSCIKDQNPAVYVMTTSEGNTISYSFDRGLAKKSIYDLIGKKARDNRLMGLDSYYGKGYEVAPEQTLASLTTIFSKRAAEALSAIFGISFLTQTISELFDSPENLRDLGIMVQTIQDLYSKHFKIVSPFDEHALDQAEKNFIEELTRTQAFKVFSDILVSTLASTLKDVKDLEHNQLPGSSINNLHNSFKDSYEFFKQSFPESLNVLLRETGGTQTGSLLQQQETIGNQKSSFVRHDCYRAGVEITDQQKNKVVVPYILLAPVELAHVSLNYDWVNSLVKNRTFFLQVAEYSDKPRTAINVYNMSKSVWENSKGQRVRFYQLGIEDFKRLMFDQNQTYYKHIEQSVIRKYNLLFNLNFTDLQSVANYLTKNLITTEQLHENILRVQQQVPDFNFIKDSDFVINEKEGKNGKILYISINPSLLLKVASAYNKSVFNAIYEDSLNQFLKNISEQKAINIDFSGLDLNDIQVKQDLCDILGFNYQLNSNHEFTSVELDNFLKSNWNATDEKGNLIHRKVLEKYFAMLSVLKDADLQIGLRMPWTHDLGTKNYKLTEQDIKDLYAGKNNIITEILQKDYSPRYIKGTKRNSAAVATSTPLSTSEFFGYGKTMRVAMVKFPKYNTTNHFGISDDLNPHDGSSHTNPIAAYFEEHSYSGHNYIGAKKTIGIILTEYGITQIKHADYVMSNEWIRRSFHDPDGTKNDLFNGDEMMRAMLIPCKITQKFVDNFIKWQTQGDNKTIEFDYPLYTFNGRQAYLADIQVNNLKLFKFTWKYIDTKEEVSSEFISQLIGKPSTLDGYILLDNVYDLWIALGGAEAMEQYADGTIDFSEKNNAVIAQMISYFDPSMKETMIAKIVDPESVKSGQMNANEAKDLTSGNLAFATLDTSKIGIQLDYTHESEDARIPALTQVITAIAFNGHNQELVNQAYEALGKIIYNSIRPILNLSARNKNLLNKYLGEKLLRTLQQNSVASTATELVTDFLDDLAKDKVLPYSHNDLFYKVTSDLISSLNRDTIKQTFAGIAVIQCPSQGIVGMYEDSKGNKYDRTTIVKAANRWIKEHPEVIQEEGGGLLSTEKLVNLYIERSTDLEGNLNFGKQLVINEDNADLIGIGDVVEINGEIKRIVAPSINDNELEKLRKQGIIDQIGLVQALNYVHNGIQIYKRLDYQRDLKVTNITWQEDDGKTVNIFETEAVSLMLDKDPLKQNLGRYWDSINRKLLKTGYYIKTYNDLKKYLKDNSKGLTKIHNYKHKFGEQVVPKVHTAFNTGRDSLAEIKSNPDYFKGLVEKRLTVYSKLKANEIGIATDGSEIILTQDPINEANTIVDYDSIARRICLKDLSGNFLCYVTDQVTFDEINNKYVKLDKDGNIIKSYNITDFSGHLSEIEGKPLLQIYVNPNATIDQLSVIKAIDNGNEKNINNITLGKNVTLKVSRFAHAIIPGLSLEENILKQSKATYNSWLLTHKAISARIPSQSYQSFLPVKTVAYTENDLNLGYMNIWEMWYQGSDFDIDKAYTLMYNISKSGKIQGNAFTDYSSVEGIEESLKLPLPKYGKLKVAKEGDSLPVTILPNEMTWELANQLIESEDIRKFELIKILINTLNKQKEEELPIYLGGFDLEAGLESTNPEVYGKANIIQKLINYKNEGQDALKNRIVLAIITQASDLENLDSSESPMSMKPVTSKIREVMEEEFKRNGSKGEFSEDVYYGEYDPFTIYNIQKNNSIGKRDVGIAANGVKAAGALQLYFNNIYRQNNITDRTDINLDLSFTDKTGRLIGKYSFFKLANTRMNEKLFRQQLEKHFGTNGNRHADYEVFQAFLKNGKFNLSDKNKKLKTIYNLWKELSLNTNSFADFLWFARNFEDNVADTISIFISMATDNAKELALAKIHGTPELLSMPLAMITLGMDIKDVVDICRSILGDVAKELEQNRFTSARNQNVRQVLFNTLAKEVDGKRKYDDATIQSMLMIYDFAQELRSITSFFSVNQGVDTKYVELSSWLTTMANDRAKKAKDRGISLAGTGITEEDLQKPLNYTELFVDGSDEQINILRQYDISKTVVNVMDVVLTSPHFSAQLSSAGTIVNLLSDISGKAYIASQLLGTNSKIKDNLEENDTEGDLSLDDLRSKQEREALTAKVLRLIDLYVRTQYLTSTEGLNFSKLDITTKFPRSQFNRTVNDGFITLKTKDGIIDFIKFITYDIIPKLKENFKDNLFLQGLDIKRDNDTNVIYYDFKYDPYELKNNPTLMENYNEAVLDFNLIKNMHTGISSSTGHNYTVGELFYLYGMITSKGFTRGLYTIVSQVNKESKFLGGGIEQEYKNLDALVQFKNEGSIAELNRIYEFLRPHTRALANSSKTAVVGTGTIDLNDEFFLPMARVEPNMLSISGMEQRLKTDIPYLTSVNINVKGGENTLSLNGNEKTASLSITFTASTGNKSITLTPKELTWNITYQGNIDNIQIANSFYSRIRSKIETYVQGVAETFLNPKYKNSEAFKDSQYFTDKNIPIDSLPEIIKKFAKGKYSIIELEGSGENYVQEIVKGLKVLVIDPNNFIGTDEQKRGYLIDLFVQNMPNRPTSENAKLTTLINILAGENIVSSSKDLSKADIEVLKNQFEEGSTEYKCIVEYSNFLITHPQIDDSSRLAQSVYMEYESTLKNRRAYYLSQFVEKMQKIDLHIGDIITVSENGINVDKICVYEDRLGQFWFTDIHPDLSKGYIMQLINIPTPGQKSNIVEFHKLLFNPNIELGKRRTYEYSIDDKGKEITTSIDYDNLIPGDKVTFENNRWVVSDVLFFDSPITNKKSKRIIMIELNGDRMLILTKVNSTRGEWILSKNYSSRSQNMLKNSFSEVARPIIQNGQSLGGKYEIKKQSNSIGAWWYLLNKLTRGSIIIVDDIEYVLSDIDDENVYTLNGLIIPKSKITELRLNSSEIDDTYFLESCLPRAVWQSKFDPVIWRPELADGYITMTDRLNKEKTDDEWNVYYAAKSIKIENKEHGFLKPTIPEDVQVTDEQDIKTGDIIVIYTLNTEKKPEGNKYKLKYIKTTEVYKVLGIDNISDPTKLKYIVEFRRFVHDDENYKYGDNIEILSLDKDDLIGYSDTVHYRKKNYNKSSYRQLYNLSENAACTEFLLNLEETTGLNVIFDENEDIFDDGFGNKVFAFVDETGIHINMNKKPENMSKETYIMSLAVHEFLHLALANLRANNPTAYYELINQYGLYSGSGENVKTMAKEHLVIDRVTRIIEQGMITGTVDDAIRLLKQEISDMFGVVSGNISRYDMRLGNYMKEFQSEFFLDRKLDISLIRTQMLSDLFFENIKKWCN